jgi:hypothetical protein
MVAAGDIAETYILTILPNLIFSKKKLFYVYFTWMVDDKLSNSLCSSFADGYLNVLKNPKFLN